MSAHVSQDGWGYNTNDKDTIWCHTRMQIGNFQESHFLMHKQMLLRPSTFLGKVSRNVVQRKAMKLESALWA